MNIETLASRKKHPLYTLSIFHLLLPPETGILIGAVFNQTCRDGTKGYICALPQQVEMLPADDKQSDSRRAAQLVYYTTYIEIEVPVIDLAKFRFVEMARTFIDIHMY